MMHSWYFFQVNVNASQRGFIFFIFHILWGHLVFVLFLNMYNVQHDVRVGQRLPKGCKNTGYYGVFLTCIGIKGTQQVSTDWNPGWNLKWLRPGTFKSREKWRVCLHTARIVDFFPSTERTCPRAAIDHVGSFHSFFFKPQFKMKARNRGKWHEEPMRKKTAHMSECPHAVLWCSPPSTACIELQGGIQAVCQKKRKKNPQSLIVIDFAFARLPHNSAASFTGVRHNDSKWPPRRAPLFILQWASSPAPTLF